MSTSISVVAWVCTWFVLLYINDMAWLMPPWWTPSIIAALYGIALAGSLLVMAVAVGHAPHTPPHIARPLRAVGR